MFIYRIHYKHKKVNRSSREEAISWLAVETNEPLPETKLKQLEQECMENGKAVCKNKFLSSYLLITKETVNVSDKS